MQSRTRASAGDERGRGDGASWVRSLPHIVGGSVAPKWYLSAMTKLTCSFITFSRRQRSKSFCPTAASVRRQRSHHRRTAVGGCARRGGVREFAQNVSTASGDPEHAPPTVRRSESTVPRVDQGTGGPVRSMNRPCNDRTASSSR